MSQPHQVSIDTISSEIQSVGVEIEEERNAWFWCRITIEIICTVFMCGCMVSVGILYISASNNHIRSTAPANNGYLALQDLDELRTSLDMHHYPDDLLNITDFGIIYMLFNGVLVRPIRTVTFNDLNNARFVLTSQECRLLDQILQLYDNTTLINEIRNANDTDNISARWSYHVRQAPNDRWITFIRLLFNKWRDQIWIIDGNIPNMTLSELLSKAPDDDLEPVSQQPWREWLNETMQEHADTIVIRVCDAEPWHFMPFKTYLRSDKQECFTCRGSQTIHNRTIWRVIP